MAECFGVGVEEMERIGFVFRRFGRLRSPFLKQRKRRESKSSSFGSSIVLLSSYSNSSKNNRVHLYHPAKAHLAPNVSKQLNP